MRVVARKHRSTGATAAAVGDVRRTPDTQLPAHRTPPKCDASDRSMTMLSPSPLAVVSDLATAPDVSVVIPFYRAQSTLGRALASVAAQTQPVQEVIIVDDASGPEAAAVLARIVSDWPHLAAKIVTLPANAGAGAARNAGWAASAGAFVAFLDADDAWHPRKIEIQSHYLRNHDEVDVCGHAHCHALAQQLQADASPVPDDLATLFRAASANIGRFSILLRNPFVTPSVMLRRDLAQRFDDGQRHMEDHRLWMRMVLSGVRVRRLGLALV
ncbi:MAG: glycosyltransferase family 2 protein, partial [Burkholderiales bacterium]